MSEAPLYNRIREIRAERGLTQADLAEQIGVSRKTINTIENMVFFPSASLALRISIHFGLKFEEVFSLEPL